LNVTRVLLLALAAAKPADPRLVDPKLHHLRSGAEREWTEFPERAEARELAVAFQAHPGTPSRSLCLRQRDVKQSWRLTINGRELGTLLQNENDLVACWDLPEGAVRDGENTLRVAPAAGPSDDIVVGRVEVSAKPMSELAREATVEVEVRDRAGDRLLPCRVTVVGSDGALVPLGARSDGHLAVTTGMACTSDGRARFGLRAGRYRLYATRGFEYGVASVAIDLGPGRTVARRLSLEREVATPGLVACDTHTHTLTYSGHGDASVEERVLAIAAEGVELPVATDHNVVTDYASVARRLGVDGWFTPAPGSEVTTPVGHFNAFPVSGAAPPHDFRDWPALSAALGRIPQLFLVLNHPRDLHSGFRPFDPAQYNAVSAESARGWVPGFQAVEVVNSGALQSDPMLPVRDWFALINRGYRIVPAGASDSHDVGRKLVGQARTYIAVANDDPASIDTAAAIESFRAGRVSVSMGLLAELRVDGRYEPGDLAPAGSRTAAIRVLGPSWAEASSVALYANGVRIRETAVSTRGRGGMKWEGTWELPRFGQDAFLVAVALGPGVAAPYWRIPKAYQPASPAWDPYVIGVTGPVWLDADGSGRFESARDYAERLVASHPAQERLIAALAGYDEAVAIQTAAVLSARGERLESSAWNGLIDKAPAPVRRGLESFIEAARNIRPE